MAVYDRDHPEIGLPRDTDRISIYQDRANEWRWRLQAGNNEVIADSAEGYVTEGGAVTAMKRVFPPKVAPGAPSVMPPISPVNNFPWGPVAVIAFLLSFVLGLLFGLWLGEDDGRGRPDPVPSVTSTIHRTITDGTVITDGKTTVLSPTTTASLSPSGDPVPNTSAP